jgi:hypothetical protein
MREQAWAILAPKKVQYASSEIDYSTRLTHSIENTEKSETYTQPPSDRGSIKFLLNGGTDSFTENFRLPPRSDRARSLNYHNQLSLEEAQSSNRSEFGAGFVNSDPATPQFFQDTFLDFFNGPFGDGQKPMDDPYNTGDLTYQTVMPQGQTTNLALPADQSVFEPERPFARALIQSILARAWQVPLDPKAQQEISANLNFILTTGRIRQFISLYFKCWQPSCAMLHVPSFDPETVPLPLLAAVAFMGAMYSSDQRETCVAKRVLDFAELFVFSSDVFSAESEVSIVFSGGRCYKDETTDWVKFQNCQAGFIILLAQYWAGSRVSRNRAMENRFSEVVKVARRMELVKARHLPDDQGHEHLWIQKECRVRWVYFHCQSTLLTVARTASIISLLDCAFFFYQNYPCRLTQSEMECDLPSDESVFFSEHPFAEPKFCFSRELTITAAFENLLEETELKPMDLTALDMFILIHRMPRTQRPFWSLTSTHPFFSLVLLYQRSHGNSWPFHTHG